MIYFYVTRVEIAGQSAQASQVVQMREAFLSQFGSAGKAILVDRYETMFKKIRFWTSFLFASLRVTFSCHRTEAFLLTRDLPVAVFAALFGFKVGCEVHHFGNGRQYRYLLRFASKCFKIHLLPISTPIKDRLLEFDLDPNLITVVPSAGPSDRKKKLFRLPRHEVFKYFGIIESDLTNKLLIVHTGTVLSADSARRFIEFARLAPEIVFVHVGRQNRDAQRLFDIDTPPNLLLRQQAGRGLIWSLQEQADFLFYDLAKTVSTFWCASPLKVYEYLSSGRPIISTVTEGAVSEVLNGNVCFIIDSLTRPDVLQVLTASNQIKRQKVAAARGVSWDWDDRIRRVFSVLEHQS